MALTLSSISSPDGERDVAIDLTSVLETDEVLTGTPTVTSDEPTILQTSSPAWNDNPITKDDGNVIAVGKGVTFHIKTLVAASKEKVLIHVHFVGDSGTAETYAISIDIVTPSLTE